MRIYIDDDSVDHRLIELLRKHNIDVVIPFEIGKQGVADPVHLAEAIRQTRLFLTHNHSDFDELSELIRVAGGQHPGILVIRKDDDRRRDMKPKDVVRAIEKLLRIAIPLQNSITVLNHYR